jgi:lipoyl-dependent peroxiredoxin
MAPIERTANGVWWGDLRGGKGQIDSTSGVLQATPYTFATRFEHAKGTNPEELIAAAHAACYSMAFANYLSGQGHTPEEIRTQATITLDNGSINKMHLVTQGRVPGLDQGAFQRLAEEADKKCPVSNLLRNGLAITIEASLL